MKTKRLYRIEEGKIISGVCGGIAEYFDLDSSLVRIGWVIFSCMAGTGVLAYIISAFILPTKSSIKN